MTKKTPQILLLIVSVLILVFVINERVIKKERKEQEGQYVGEVSQVLCNETVSDSEGPFYIKGTPFTNKLAPPGASGEKLVIRGIVTQTDCRKPVEGAVIDIWHADANGNYDNTWYRGKVRVDDEGNYQFETIRPSGYSSGVIRRPAHIHFKVFKDDRELLTSQMYFEKTVETAESQAVSLGKQNQVLTGTFNIIINP